MEINLIDVLKMAAEKKASDIFIVTGLPLSLKIRGDIQSVTEQWVQMYSLLQKYG